MTTNERRLVVGLGLFALAALMCAGSLGIGLMIYRADSTAGGGTTGGSSLTDAVATAVGQAVPEMSGAAATPAAGRVRAGQAARADAAPTVQREDLPLRDAALLGSTDLTRLYTQVNPGVVSLVVEQEIELMGQTIQQLGGGSGFVYDDRHVVTNNHVSAEQEQVEVIFYDGQRRQGTVVGTDAYSDLSVVRVDDLPANVRPLPLLGDFASLRVGQPVVAIGNPFGRANSMSYGIISALGRTIPANLDSTASFGIPQTIQTDAAINPGNSGGPLLDLSGRVIGINAQINTTNVQPGGGPPASSGVGYAIPASIVAKVVPELIASGGYEWSYLGVAGLDQDRFTVEVAAANNLPEARGAYIAGVRPDGPSVNILRGATNTPSADDPSAADDIPVGGDVVIAIDDQPIGSFDDLLTYISIETRPGQTVTLTIIRGGQQQDVEVTIAKRPGG